ncbi:MAG: GNAT family N-acetyltransferase [Actinobacteria bacterium]|nr:GNAT family N-acetyltransferase [Actinomycetota bacterium]
MLIRECAATDIEALERHMPTRPSQVHAEHFGQHQAGLWTYLIAWDNDSVPVGVCVIRWGGWAEREALEAYPDCPEVTNLQVHPAQRGRGVGTALIESAEKKVRARGLRRIGIGAADDNPRAAMLYARLGYADTGLRTDSRYLYPDDAGVPREIIEHNILLVKNLEVVSPAEGTDSASDGRS